MIEEILDNVAGSPPSINFGEYSVGDYLDDTTGADHWQAISGALCHALIFETASRDTYNTNVFGANYFLGFRSAVVGGGEFYITPYGLAYKLMAKHFGDRRLADSQSAIPSRSIEHRRANWYGADLTAFANLDHVVFMSSKDPVSGKLFIMAINTTKTSIETINVAVTGAITFNENGTGIADNINRIHTLSAAALTDLNTLANPRNVAITSELFKDSARINNYTNGNFDYDFPAASITVFEVEPTVSGAVAPFWPDSPLISKAGGTVGKAYNEMIIPSVDVIDMNDDTLTFSVLPVAPATAWLSIAADGTLSGTPDAAGVNEFDITADDGTGNQTVCRLKIKIVPILGALELVATPDTLALWTFNQDEI